MNFLRKITVVLALLFLTNPLTAEEAISEINAGEGGESLVETPELISKTTFQYEVGAATFPAGQAYEIVDSTITQGLTTAPTVQYVLDYSTYPYRVFMSTIVIESMPMDLMSFKFIHNDIEVKDLSQEGAYRLPDRFILPGSFKLYDKGTGGTLYADYSVDYSEGIFNVRELQQGTTAFSVSYACFPFNVYTEFVSLNAEYMTERTRELSYGQEETAFKLFKDQYYFDVHDSTGPVQLKHGLLVPGQEVVWINKRIKKPGKDYDIDYYNGRVTFRDPIESPSSHKIRYKYFPFDIIVQGQKEFFLDISFEELIAEVTPDRENTYDLFSKEDKFKGTEKAGPYYTTGKFITPHSEKVVMNEAVLTRDEDYFINYRSGRLDFSEVIPKENSFIAAYRHFPFRLMDLYGREKQAATGQALSTRTKFAVQHRQSPSKIDVGGAQTISLDFGGGKGPAISQSFNMDLKGRVSEDIEVQLLLSDQSLSLQPSGNTEVVEDLDKIYVEVKVKESKLIMGDYSINFTGSEFNRYTKKLEGLKGEGRFEKTDIDLFSAVTGGGYATVEVQGAGTQGPYQLRVNGKQVVIKAGTETVYLDDGSTGGGLIKMERGEGKDYTIEYGSGELTFEPRQPISAAMKIVVEFEYTSEYYTRSTIGLQARSKNLLKGKANIGVTLLQEADSAKTNPTLWDDSDKDNPDPKTEEWVYISSNTISEITGLQGSTTTQVLPPPPLTHSIVSLDGNMKAGKVTLAGEVAYSNKDLNNIYDRALNNDERDPGRILDGLASKLKLSSTPADMKLGKIPLGNIGFSGNFRTEGANFLSLTRSKPMTFTDKWNIGVAETKTSRINLDGSIDYRPTSFLSFSPNIEVMQEYKIDTDTWTIKDGDDKPANEDYVSRRSMNLLSGIKGINLKFDRMRVLPGILNIKGYFDDLVKDSKKRDISDLNVDIFEDDYISTRKRRDISADWQIWKLKPTAGLYHEELYALESGTTAKKNTSYYRDVFKYGINVLGIDWMTLSLKRENADRWVLQQDTHFNVWKDTDNTKVTSESVANAVNFKFSPGRGTYFQTDINYSDRVTTSYEYVLDTTTASVGLKKAPEDVRTDLINLKMLYKPKFLKKAFSVDMKYDLSKNYSRISSTTAISNLKTSVRVNLTPLNLRPKKAGWLINGLLLNWSLSSNISMSEKTQETPDNSLKFLKRRWDQFGWRPSQWRLSGSRFAFADKRESDIFNHNHTFKVFPGSNLANFKMEFRNGDSNYRYADSLKNVFSDNAKYEIKSNIIKQATLVVYQSEKNNLTTKKDAFNTVLSSTGTKKIVTNATLTYTFSKDFNFSFKYDYTEDYANATQIYNNDPYRKEDSRVLTGKYSIGGKGDVSLSYTRKIEQYVDRDNIPYILKINGTYRIGSNMSLRASLSTEWRSFIQYPGEKRTIVDLKKDIKHHSARNYITAELTITF